MATKNNPDKGARPKKKADDSSDELSAIMAIDDEDLEILQMTERTLTGPSTDEEETIAINDKPNKKKSGNETAKTADLPYDFDDLAEDTEEVEVVPEEVKADEEGDEDSEEVLELEADEPEIEIEEEAPPPVQKTTRAVPAPKAEKTAPSAKAAKPAAPKAAPAAAAQKAAKPAPAPKTSKPAPAPKAAPVTKAAKAAPAATEDADAAIPQKSKGIAGLKNLSYKTLLLILVPVVVTAIILILVLHRQPDEFQMISSAYTGQPATTPAPVPESASQTKPAPPPAGPGATSQPQTARPAIQPGAVPQPQDRPAVQSTPVIAPAAPKAPVVNDAAQDRPATPVPQPPQVKPQPATAAAPQTVQAMPPATAQATQPQQPATVATAQAPKPASVPDKNAVRTLKGVDFTESAGTVQMKILIDNPAVEYKCFALSGPTRVVVDLMGKWNKPPFEDKNVSTSRVSRIRVGKYDDKVRIVADISGGGVSSPTVTAGPDGLVVSIP